MKIYGHPWSINTRKTLMTLAEKGHEAEFSLVMLPRGEQKLPEHVARHPFGKVPVLDDDGFVLYETRAINAYLDRKLPGPSLTPTHPRELALLDQFTNAAEAYLVPHAMPVIMEKLFRRYLGGEQNVAACFFQGNAARELQSARRTFRVFKHAEVGSFQNYFARIWAESRSIEQDRKWHSRPLCVAYCTEVPLKPFDLWL